MLKAIISDVDRVFAGDAIPDKYLFDDYVGKSDGAYAVCLPITHDEVKKLVIFANKENLKIVARGAGTGLSGATAPLTEDTLIIDLSKMNKIH